jgi:Kinetochore complex Sim4 subunit Fta1
MAAMTVGSASPSPPPPSSKLHNTSFTLTRLTPLYSFITSRLHHYAREFRDIVRGDVIRGVQVNTQPSDRAKSALVRSCEWTIENDLLPTEPFDCLTIKVDWDDGSGFTAIILPNFTSSETVSLGKRKRSAPNDNDVEFTSLPLLLTRGPQVVTQQLITYITTRFDSRASQLNLPPEFLGDCLQGYLQRVLRENVSLRTIDRSLKILELMFTTPEPTTPKVKGALRKITLSLGAQDVQELYRR